jgi:3-methyladenine DNA glycosylase AlkC
MPKRFSKRFDTFDDWNRQAWDSEYANTIRRLHALHPNATLAQLRRAPTEKERAIGSLRKTALPKLPWEALTVREKNDRMNSLKVLSMLRGGRDLHSATREVHVRLQTVQKHLGSVIVRRKGEFVAKSNDRISRGLVIYENGRQSTITVKSSREASKIGEYFNAVRIFLDTGDKSALRQFKNVKIKDRKGVKHSLETNPEKIKDIEEGKEDREFHSIYYGVL